MASYESYEELKIDVADGVATVTINRPERRNSINADLHEELETIWRVLDGDDDVKAILLTGAGETFSVGGDVKAMAVRPGGDVVREGETHMPSFSRSILRHVLEVEKPVVCAINGDCIGLAATLALCCDITVAADTARIGDTHVSRVGLVAGDGGAVVWPLLVGPSRAKEYLMRGTLITGTRAEEIGLVNHVAPKAEVVAAAREIATELANGPAWAIRWTKLSINSALKERVNSVLIMSGALEHLTFSLPDHKEATRAFAEKRKPNFGKGPS